MSCPSLSIWPVERTEPFLSLHTATLKHCIFHTSQDHPCSPTALRTMFSISEKQYFQVCLVGLTLCQNWTEIDTLLTTKVEYNSRNCLSYSTLCTADVHTLLLQYCSILFSLTSQGVFGFGKKKKSPIGFDRVVRTLGNPKLIRRPPADVRN